MVIGKEIHDGSQRLKTSVTEPPELELKRLPEHLEYAFLAEDSKLLVIIASSMHMSRKESEWPFSRSIKG